MNSKLPDHRDKARPRNVDFSTLKLPLPAITSITHRLSGAFIFIGVAFLLYLLDQSLRSEDGFAEVAGMMDNLLAKIVVWAIVAGLLYHLIAGIKHLLMDVGIGESLEGGLLGARLVVIFSTIAIIAAGIWLW